MEQPKIRRKEYEVSLIKRQGNNSWVITAYKLYQGSDDDSSVGGYTSTPTHINPTITRDDMGASDKTSVPSTDTQDNQKIRYSVRHAVEPELDRPLSEVFDSLIDERIDEAYAK